MNKKFTRIVNDYCEKLISKILISDMLKTKKTLNFKVFFYNFATIPPITSISLSDDAVNYGVVFHKGGGGALL